MTFLSQATSYRYERPDIRDNIKDRIHRQVLLFGDIPMAEVVRFNIRRAVDSQVDVSLNRIICQAMR